MLKAIKKKKTDLQIICLKKNNFFIARCKPNTPLLKLNSVGAAIELK